jgi:hypothetical protein
MTCAPVPPLFGHRSTLTQQSRIVAAASLWVLQCLVGLDEPACLIAHPAIAPAKVVRVIALDQHRPALADLVRGSVGGYAKQVVIAAGLRQDQTP